MFAIAGISARPSLSDISISGITGWHITVQVAEIPLLTVADIVAVPAFRPAILPVLSTLIIDD